VEEHQTNEKAGENADAAETGDIPRMDFPLVDGIENLEFGGQPENDADRQNRGEEGR
jgi:hypothetical protein